MFPPVWPRITVVTLTTAALAAGLSSCGSFEKISEKGKVDYKTTAQAKPLDIPPDLTSVSADDRFVVPDVGSRGVATASAANSPVGTAGAGATSAGGQAVLVQATDARIERNGNQRWLVVNRPVEQVWPLVREFWLQSGFVLKVDRPEIGILETDWAENRAKIPMDGVRRIVGKVFDGLYSSDELDRYRTRIERTESGTEIFISHRGLREVYEDATNVKTIWTPRASDPELEAEFLNRILLRLAGDATKSAADVKTAAAPVANQPESRVKLVQVSDTERRLQVREGFDRTWRRVGLALDRTGFAVEDRDRSKGTYFVQYRSPDERVGGKPAPKVDDKPGFLTRVFSSGSKDKANAEVRLEGRYRIRVATADGRTEVSATSNEGQPLTTALAERILGMLESELR